MASPFNPGNTTLLVDVSKYVPVSDVALLKASGVRGIIARMGEGVNDTEDKTWAYYVQEAQNNDIPAFGYYVIHPELYDNAPGNVAEHLKRIKKFAQNKDIRGIFIDAEIFKDDRGLNIASGWISERTRSLIDEVQRAFPNLIVGLYTGGWYVDGYSPEMKNWIYKYPLWWAWYTQPIGQGLEIEWKDLPNYYPSRTPTNLPPDATGQGAAKMNLWQWTGDHFKLPGMYSRDDKSVRAACDLNFFMGDEQAFFEWCGYGPRGTTPTTPTDPGDGDNPSGDDPAGGTPDVVGLDTLVSAINANTAQLKRIADFFNR